MFFILLAIAFLIAWKLPIKSSGLQCDPTGGVATALIIGAGAFNAYNQVQEGKAADKYYQYQAQSARQQGDLSLRTGQKQSEVIQDVQAQQGKQLKTSQAEFNATQRANAAASGASGGTLDDITNNTFSKEKLDELALRYNSDVKSWEATENAKNTNWTLQNQATGYEFAGKQAKVAGKRKAFATLLGTASSVGTNFAFAPKVA